MAVTFMAALGDFPRRTPLNARITGQMKFADYRIEKIIFESQPGFFVTAALFLPLTPGPHPAVVLLHGRSGPYSSKVNANCKAIERGVPSACGSSTLSGRHSMWGEYWAAHGYVALLVDSFGPRGRGQGYGRYTHGAPERDAVNELTVRPADAVAALDYLSALPRVQPHRVMLQGWSNGASTTLNVLHNQVLAAPKNRTSQVKFRAALAFYPGCGPKAVLARKLQLDVPLTVFLASDDEEVSPVVCRELLARSGGEPIVVWYPGATHDFDNPDRSRQSVAANRTAHDDALRRAVAIFDGVP